MAYIGNLQAITPDGVWSETINLFDENTGDAIDLTGCSFKMTFRASQSPSDDYGWVSYSVNDYVATSDAGNITILGIGYAAISFVLQRGLYNILLELSRDGFDIPVLTGTLQISNGLSI